MITAIENVLGLTPGSLDSPFGIMICCCIVFVFVQLIAKTFVGWLEKMF